MADLTRQTLAGAGEIVLAGGLFFKLIESGAPVDITIETGGATKRIASIEAGYQYGPVPEEERFRRVRIVSSAGQTIAALVGEQYEDYDRILGVFRPQQPASLADAVDVDVGGSAAAVQLRPANAARRRITFKLNEGATVDIRIGANGTVAANRGIKLTAGQSITLEPISRIDAIREAAGVAVVSIIEEVY